MIKDNVADFQFDSIEDGIEEIRKGRVIVVVDDEDRENEGDFVCAAEMITPEIVNFMATHGRGLICAPITNERADQLGLQMMSPQNTSHHETAFTISVDYNGKGCTTGISAYDRATCLRALADPNSLPKEFARPGHIFPLKAKAGGVLQRIGHTEASVDLAQLAGLAPAGVLVEILNEDGSMARLNDLIEISKTHKLKIISIKDLVAYRMRTEKMIIKGAEFEVNILNDTYSLMVFDQKDRSRQHIALRYGEWSSDLPVPVRVESLRPNDVLFRSLLGNLNDNIKNSLEIIKKEGRGLLIFVNRSDDGQPIERIVEGLLQRQSKSLESLSERQKDIGIGVQIILSQGVKKIRLITNHPERHVPVHAYGLEIEDKIELKA